MNRIILIFCFFISICYKIQPDSQTEKSHYATYSDSGKSLKYILDSLKINSNTLRILIVKSRYELSVWSDTLEIKKYPVVFGTNPVDDKLREGDRCTPEGEFKIRSKYPHKSWTKFIWIDYPNKDSWRKHNLAIKQGLIHIDSKIGGEVGIHGVPKNCDYVIDQRQNWTWGCISLKNKDIDEIYEVINMNTMVRIIK
jgi:murein L,D-transpeptidase YafK